MTGVACYRGAQDALWSFNLQLTPDGQALLGAGPFREGAENASHDS